MRMSIQAATASKGARASHKVHIAKLMELAWAGSTNTEHCHACTDMVHDSALILVKYTTS
eukprot:3471151-Pyramimonas_sp.AAC.2